MDTTFDYPQRRLEAQRQWHNAKAAWNRRWFYRMEIATLSAGAVIPVLNLLLVSHPHRAAILSGVFGALVVVAAALGKLFKFHENWLQYRTVVEALTREQELYLSGAAEYAELEAKRRNQLLVQRVEEILSATTARFVATHRTGANAETQAR